MGITSYYQGLSGTPKPTGQTPVSTGSGITSYYNNLKPTPTSTVAPIKIAPNATNISQKPNLLNTAINAVKKIGKDITLSFIPPKVPPRLPDSAFQQQKVEPKKPISIKPDQKKLTPEQMLKTVGGLDTKQQSSAQVTDQIKKQTTERLRQIREKFRTKTVEEVRRPIKKGYKEPGILGSMVEELAQSTTSLVSGGGATIEMIGNMSKSILLTAAGKKIQKEADKVLASNPEWAADPMEKWGTKKVARLVTAAVPSLLSVIAATMVAGPVGGIVAGFGMEAGPTYKEAKEKGVSEGKAQQYGVTVGVVNSVLERIFPSKLLGEGKRTVVKTISKSLVKDVLSTVKKYGLSFAKNGAIEGSTEALQEMWSNVIATNYDKNRKIWDNIFESFVGGFGAGGVAGVVESKVNITEQLKEGEHTPQEVIGTVLKNNLDKTPEGRELIKSAVEAQKTGQNITIEKQQPSTPQGGVPPVEGGGIKEVLKQKYPEVDFFVYEKDGKISLDKIIVPKSGRNQGVGTKFMNDLVSYADKTNQKLVTTPTSDFGGSKNRLTDFYKKFGFIENKGRTIDHSILETMLRNPKPAPSVVEGGVKEGGKTTPPVSPTVKKVSGGEVTTKPIEVKKPIIKPQTVSEQEVETPVSKEVDEFVKDLDKKYGEEGFISLEGLKKPDLEGMKRFIKKIGTREEQIGEDAFWQQQLFQAKRETNIRNITKEVQEKFAPELMVNLLDKIPYVDKDAAVRIARSIQKLDFIKERNRQQLLYKTASAIKELDASGNPVFGTKIQKVLDDGTIKEDWRYTPEEAKLLWSKLTIKERRILKDYMLPIEKAKSVFSRELLKQKAGVEKGVEGYIHKYYEDKIGDRFKKIFFKFRRAAPTKTRTRYINPETGKVEELKGNVEDFEKSVIKQMENITNTEEYNKFIQIWQELLTEPLNDKNPLKKGWVEVRGTLKTGIPTDKPRIFKTEEGYGVAPQVRRQTPIAIKDMYMKEMGEVGETYAIVNGIRSLARFWQGNVLIYPGTAATNAISGGIQYGTKIINDFYKDGVLSGNFKPFIYDIVSLIDALRPSVVEKLRPELIGAQVNIATQFGKPANFLDKFLEIGLTPFGMVETYWKRVISDATLRGIGKKPEDILTEYGTFKKVAKESDIYGYNYSNIPAFLEKWRGSAVGSAIYPFITYPYKYARFLERYTLGAVKEVFTGNKKDGFAKLLTLASIISILYFFQHKKEEKIGEYVDEMKYPGEFDKTGRIKIGETSEKESYLRVIKYPWLNFMKILQSGADIVKGNKEKGVKEISGIGQEFVSEGPLLNVTNLLLGKVDKFSMYKSKGVLWGEIAKSFIPVFRINESISMLINPEKTKQDTFKQAIERVLYMKPSGEVKTGFGGEELQYNREEEFLKFAFGINIRSIDRTEYEQAKSQVIQNMVNRLDDEDILPKSRERAIEVLKIFGVEEYEYDDYLYLRKKRMSESRKKDKFKIE